MYQHRDSIAPQRANPRAYAQDRRSQHTSYRQDFVELNNLPSNVRNATSPESQLYLRPESISDESRNLIRNDPNHFAVLDRELPSHVKQAAPPHSTYAQLSTALPSHVKPAAQFASPSQNFNATGYKTAMPLTKKRERSCFGLCFCSGKACVIFTTIASLILTLAMYFLWMRRPGFAPASEIIFKGEPFALSNETLSIFHSDIMYTIRISNSNFYPLRLVKMPAKVYDSATGSVIGSGELKNIYIPALGESYANLTITLDFRVSSSQVLNSSPSNLKGQNLAGYCSCMSHFP
ncbi:hypothetical protein DSO57_1018170 [Entomophthora muscae]|uniref:Uncharacterized protein n=1 Tax=Entomophthora muscae TaxID=34485 RepID=A0ACC2UE27_9FUNG|nr:hypothetical protein DSO57_1018170 [Entomophthora muscae]